MGGRRRSWQRPGRHFRIIYSPRAEDHLRALSARQRAIVLDSVDEQLASEPAQETRNRKFMRPNPLAPWELRIGQMRVYYDVGGESESVVSILAIGIKIGDQVYIGGEAVDL